MQNPFHTSKTSGNDKTVVRDGVWAPGWSCGGNRSVWLEKPVNNFESILSALSISLMLFTSWSGVK